MFIEKILREGFRRILEQQCLINAPQITVGNDRLLLRARRLQGSQGSHVNVLGRLACQGVASRLYSSRATATEKNSIDMKIALTDGPINPRSLDHSITRSLDHCRSCRRFGPRADDLLTLP
ncbi:hypothetical protein EMIT0215P_60019 [Pseudomonas serboccidentalis]